MSNGTADKVAQKVKSIVIDLGKDRDDDHVDTYVPKVFDESLISFKKLSRRRLLPYLALPINQIITNRRRFKYNIHPARGSNLHNQP